MAKSSRRFGQDKPSVCLTNALTSVLDIDGHDSGEGGAKRQAEALMKESVYVDNPNALEGYIVDLNDYGWFPDVLPSEAAEDEE
jgi:hypothetical protein